MDPLLHETDDDESVSIDLSDVSLNRDASFVGQEQESQEIRQLNARSKGDNLRIRFWRVVVTGSILLTAAAVSVTTYLSLRKEEKINFETAYQQFARTVGDAAIGQRRDMRQGYRQLADAITAGAQASNASFPFYTVPLFESYARNFFIQSKAERVGYRNLVLADQVEAWLDYADAHYQDAYRESHMMRYGSMDHLKPNGYKKFIYRQSSEGPVPEIERDFYFPAYLVSPPAYTYGIINFNHMSVPDFGDAMMAALALKYEVVSTKVRPYAEAAAAVFAPGEHEAMHDELPPGEPEHPHSFFYLPVFERLNDYESPVVGMMQCAISWDPSMRNLLPDNVKGIMVVTTNNCGDVFSYEINGPKASFLGSKDFHNDKYDHLLHEVDLAFHTNPDFETTPGHCKYKMHIYPTEVFENEYYTDTPLYNSVIVAATFVFTAAAFLFYDIFVQRRNAKLVADAARSNAIVTQLFPGAIGDQMIGRNNPKEANMASSEDKLGNTDGQAKSSKALAELYLDASVIYADIAGFDAWCSTRSAEQVFTLLETVFQQFDNVAKKRRIFKVETVGDCYVATSGLPDARKGHAIEMARFARDILSRMHLLVKKLEVQLGPDTADLSLRVGIHSGPITAGVLRGERARFQLFGDTIQIAQQIKATSGVGRIQVSKQFAELLQDSGKADWLRRREDAIPGGMETFWLTMSKANSHMHTSSHEASESGSLMDLPAIMDTKKERLVDWCCETLQKLLKQIAVRRLASGTQVSSKAASPDVSRSFGSEFLEEVQEIITLPEYDSALESKQQGFESIELSDDVVDELRTYVSCIANMYRENDFHSFEHASHVLMSVNKLMMRIVAPSDKDFNHSVGTLHDHTYGITSDPLTQFACAFSALIHDADHVGVPNAQLVKEEVPVAALYGRRSVAEQNSLDLAWKLLTEEQFRNLRGAIYSTEEELVRFRELVVNSVMATDIVDKDLKQLRNNRWDKAFKTGVEQAANDETARGATNRKATIVIEHLIQASDVSHTMQHWQVYRKWNERFFRECYKAYQDGRAENDPTEGWYKGEIGFFDFYIIPLAKKLKDCGVFGVSSGEYLNYALQNREQWELRGREVVAEMIEDMKGEAQQAKLC